MNIQKIISDCKNKNLNYDYNDVRKILRIQIPKARNDSNIILTSDIVDIIAERNINLLDYKYIEGYEAIWSIEQDIIECEVELPQRHFSFERYFRNNSICKEEKKILIETHLEGIVAELSEISNEFHILEICKDIGRPIGIMGSYNIERFDRRKSSSTSLKISGLNISTHEQALNIIKTIFASICFQFDCKTNIPLMLAIARNYSRARLSHTSLDDLELTRVNQHYDNEALSLYWYAQSALGMPLLQYLALYQVVEFYYPIYSELAAQKKVANALKDPSFNSHNTKDIARIFNIVKTASSTRSELSQLEATLKECVEISLLRDWLKSDSKRDEYFRSKNAVKLSEYKINSHVTEDDELLRQVLQRFYNIRCRIVHTKGVDAELEVLHPQSKEVKYLEYDIELANFLAHRVLISSSKPM
ncbi:hypothetical protein I2494_06740 [Budviciaceae bacterium BWR-B9]|uniref:Apea-like HEPN domain-containing protein n=1 Tax=Limnobaculum allomyrinae TaxID=2791986 RepID=A0ABS1INT8_9GAMM|nr:MULTISPECIES: hypothetical protein [Limnobaculum]MBK5143418.1 hypothetical protein [Limnobaculum allomyrinae]MBV7691306.1 hypothetical protein [Limnobaculum sp. M2-1]